MRITIETMGEMTELPHGGRGSVCHGVTEDGVPVVAVLMSIACDPRHRSAFERSLQATRDRGGAAPCDRREASRRNAWRDRLFGLPPMAPDGRA